MLCRSIYGRKYSNFKFNISYYQLLVGTLNTVVDISYVLLWHQRK